MAVLFDDGLDRLIAADPDRRLAESGQFIDELSEYPAPVAASSGHAMTD